MGGWGRVARGGGYGGALRGGGDLDPPMSSSPSLTLSQLTAAAVEARLASSHPPPKPKKSQLPSSPPLPSASQVRMHVHTIDIAHKHSLDLVEITLALDLPVIEAVNVDRHLHGLRRRDTRVASAKKGGGGISDRLLKEYKICAGIAKHDLVRKVDGMMEYLGG
jgi:hypothetical protein